MFRAQVKDIQRRKTKDERPQDVVSVALGLRPLQDHQDEDSRELQRFCNPRGNGTSIVNQAGREDGSQKSVHVLKHRQKHGLRKSYPVLSVASQRGRTLSVT